MGYYDHNDANEPGDELEEEPLYQTPLWNDKHEKYCIIVIILGMSLVTFAIWLAGN